MLKSLCASRVVEIGKAAAGGREFGEQGRRRPVVVVLRVQGHDRRVDVCNADTVRPIHRSAARGRKTHAVNVTKIDVAGTADDPFGEQPRSFIDEGVEASGEYFLVRD